MERTAPSDEDGNRGHPVYVLLCHAAADEGLADELIKHLVPLQREGVVGALRKLLVEDAENPAEGLVGVEVSRAGMVLSLLSADFLAAARTSDEVTRATAQCEHLQGRVLPVILRPCAWHVSAFGGLKPLPSNAAPVTSWRDKDEALFTVAMSIRQILLEPGDPSRARHPFAGPARVNDRVEAPTRYDARKLRDALRGFSPAAIRIATEQPLLWEGFLFSQVLADELHASDDLKRELQLGVYYGPLNHITRENLFSVLGPQLGEAQRLVDNLRQLATFGFKDAMGPPGVPADPIKIAYVARRIGDGYREAIRWTLQWRCYQAQTECQRLVSLVEGLTGNLINEIEAFSASMIRELPAYVNAAVSGKRSGFLSLTLTITVPNEAEILHETKRLKRLFGYR